MIPVSALSRAEMALRLDEASEHLMTEVDEKARLTYDGQEVNVVKASLVEVDSLFRHCDLFLSNIVIINLMLTFSF